MSQNQKIKLHKDVTLLPVDQIKRNNWNPNFLSTAMQRAIRDDITRNGFIGPIVVQKHNRELDQDYVIINGEHRYDAFLDLNIGNKIPATVLDIDDTTAKVLTLRLNREHGELMPDKVNSLLNRVKDALPEDNQDELFEITGMSEGDIRLISSLDIAEEGEGKAVRAYDTSLETPTDPSVDLYLQWSDIENAARKVAEQLVPIPEKTKILAIGNGGLIPAKLISELLEVEFVDVIPKDLIGEPIGTTVEKLIVVDDIYDKGKTYRKVIESLNENQAKIEYAVLVSKPDPAKKGIKAGIVTHSKQWVVFPWEKLRESG
jgi:hypoxanthine phosphoribosyltransferase